MSFVFLVIWPLSPAEPFWVQVNFLEENLRRLVPSSGVNEADIEPDEALVARFFERDLSGTPVMEFPQERRNVIILVLEGISFEVASRQNMPQTFALADGSIFFPEFLALQRQSYRGLYSIFCGDYPNFMTRDAKTDIVGMYGSGHRCLPQVLRENGFRTVFLQGSRMRFMQMDKFTAKAGFDEARQIVADDKYSFENQWGVDDRFLLKQVIRHVQGLEAGDKPWLLSVFTAGTHHPFNVPGNLTPSYLDAVRFLDRALSDFIRELKETGVLDDTLLIITSDESSHYIGRRKNLLPELDTNHIPMFVFAPKVDSRIIQDEMFLQSDIQLGVLDYLGIDSGTHPGRSVFRRYKTGRPVLFGNVYASKFYAYIPDGRLYICAEGSQCLSYTLGGSHLFNSPIVRAQARPLDVASIWRAVQDNNLTWNSVEDETVFIETDKEYAGARSLLEHLVISVDIGQSVIWNSEITAFDPIDVQVLIREHKSYADNSVPYAESIVFSETKNIPAGKSFRFARKYTATEDIEGLASYFFVHSEPGARYKVERLSVTKQSHP